MLFNNSEINLFVYPILLQQDAVHLLTLIEKKMTISQWLLKKFTVKDLYMHLEHCDMQKFNTDLVTLKEVSIQSSPGELPSSTNLGKLIYNFFNGHEVALK